MDTTHDIAKAILDDKTMTFDDVEHLFDVLRAKQQRIARAQKLRVGDRVVLRSIKPKYLTGQPATIRGSVGPKIEVELDAPIGRYGRKIMVVRTCLEKIEAPTQTKEVTE